ncbi:unnamed protein product [Caenorhabditis angaria]|uniref:Uncharacterized protein n=1 Tax=Caenorhabditis angaria TaxID=860376 RepID=A0A9P1MVS0_9PELO|nr:unnamed protein product [Caenorhabditis angaria]
MPVAVISGASSGIGKATALLFAKNGYDLSLTGRNQAALEEVASLCRQQGAPQVIVTAIELTDENAPKQIVEATLAKYSKIDTLINSAGILRNGMVIDSEIDVYDEIMNVNVRSLIRLTRSALPHIIAQKGTIVNVSSITGPCPFPGVTYYCMTKAAVDQFTKCLALEMAPNGVRVNAVCPGVVVTNCHLASGQSEETYKEFLEKCKTTHALGRTGTPNEVAEGILFLASDKSSFTTGELLRIDGGRGIMHPR